MNIFQRGLILKNKFQSSESELYLKCNKEYNDEFKFLRIRSNSLLTTDTYFNILSVGKIKQYTCIDSVSLNLLIKGKGKIFVYHIDNNKNKIEILTKEFDFSEKNNLTLEIKGWGDLEGGVIYFSILSISVVDIWEFNYFTESKKTQEVKLCIVITHYNRQNNLIPALQRIRKYLFDSNISKKIDLIISDNSQNLDYEGDDRITIFKNSNYGGSGGFAFGLFKAKKLGYTHCLFMDDDASTEIECILRTYDLLSYSNTNNLAIVGSMLYEDRQNIQHENGALLKDSVESIGRNLDLLDIENLVINELNNKIDYAGWWFFAFPILEEIIYPFPFFVRGDDVSFGVANKFNMMTINGICSWQEDFSYKHSDFLHYLNIRSLYVMNLVSQAKGGVLGFYIIMLRSFLTGIFTCRYNLSIASIEALRDILSGEKFWTNNLDLSSKRNILQKKFYDYQVIDTKNILDFNEDFQESSILKFFRIVTFNGFLVPSLFFKNTLNVPFYKVRPKNIFLIKRVVFFDRDNRGYGFYYSKSKSLILYFKFILLLLSSIFYLPYLYLVYPRIYKKLTAESFWEKAFSITGDHLK